MYTRPIITAASVKSICSGEFINPKNNNISLIKPDGFNNNIHAKRRTTRLEKKGKVTKNKKNILNLGFSFEIHKAVG